MSMMWLLDALWLLPPIVLPALAVFYFCIADYQDERSGVVSMLSGKLGGVVSSSANIGRRLVGARVAGACEGVLHYVVYERNPLMQFFYCAILCFESVTVSTEILPTLPTRYLSNNHYVYTFLAVFACGSSFLACIFSDPGVITSKNRILYRNRYQFGLMFPSGVQCRTCGFEKVARSKHCRLCNRCVARFDHHCQWLNVCIGANNLAIFLLFLLVHVVCTSYASYLAIFAFIHVTEEKSLFTARFMDTKGNPLEPNLFTVTRHLIGHSNTCMVLLLALSVTFALCLFVFLGYHLYLIIRNQTTNETFKLQEMKDNIEIAEKKSSLQQCRQISRKSSSTRLRKFGKDQDSESSTSYDLGQISSFYNRGILRNVFEALNVERTL